MIMRLNRRFSAHVFLTALILLAAPVSAADTRGDRPQLKIETYKGKIKGTDGWDGTKKNMPPELINSLLKAVMTPVTSLAKSVNTFAMQNTNALGWIHWDLMNDLKSQRAKGLRSPVPDLSMIKTYLKILMSMNNGELTRGGGYKDYPSDKDFQRAAKEAQKKIRRFIEGYPKKKDVLARSARDPVGRSLAKSMKLMVMRLPSRFGNKDAVKPPPASPEEMVYFNKARTARREDGSYTFPPWPGRQKTRSRLKPTRHLNR